MPAGWPLVLLDCRPTYSRYCLVPPQCFPYVPVNCVGLFHILHPRLVMSVNLQNVICALSWKPTCCSLASANTKNELVFWWWGCGCTTSAPKKVVQQSSIHAYFLSFSSRSPSVLLYILQQVLSVDIVPIYYLTVLWLLWFFSSLLFWPSHLGRSPQWPLVPSSSVSRDISKHTWNFTMVRPNQRVINSISLNSGVSPLLPGGGGGPVAFVSCFGRFILK